MMLRQRTRGVDYYNPVVRFLESFFPDIRAHVELRTLPLTVKDWSKYAGLVNWLPTYAPISIPAVYRQLKELETLCDERNVAFINRPDAQREARKSTCAKVFRFLGVRAPMTHVIDDIQRFREEQGGLQFPLIVRGDIDHGGYLPMYRVESRAELARVPIEMMRHPIGMEFIDVRDTHDGLYRRYRYLAIGDLGMPRNIHCSANWEARANTRSNTADLLEEEKAFIRKPVPHHKVFQQARQEMGLDVAAFDYSYMRDGRMVVWEVNLLPNVAYTKLESRLAYRREHTDRIIAALVRLYLNRTGLSVPEKLCAMLIDDCVTGYSAADGGVYTPLVA